MNVRRTTVAVFSIVLLFACTTWAFEDGPFSYYYPAEGTHSVFFQNYTPEHLQEVIKPFVSMQQSVSSNLTAGAGTEFVTNERTIEPYFAIQPETSAFMLAALRDDVMAQLVHDGAKIMSQSGDYSKGSSVTYRLGQNIGTATFSSTVTDRMAGHYTLTGAMVPPPEGSHYMLASITISEKWFPKEAKAIQALVAH